MGGVGGGLGMGRAVFEGLMLRGMHLARQGPWVGEVVGSGNVLSDRHAVMQGGMLLERQGPGVGAEGGTG